MADIEMKDATADLPPSSIPSSQRRQTHGMTLLEKAQAMIEIDQKLSATLEEVEPWLLNKKDPKKSVNPHRPIVRPIPTNMDQVHTVLAVARNLANRTSAPAGWNPAAPVVGFSTPSPMPHQLRGGALAALQLERARQAERDKKLKLLQQQQQRKRAAAEEEAAAANKQGENEKDIEKDPKRREIDHDKERIKHQNQHQRQQRRPSHSHLQRQQAAPEKVSMNLSDSSSDDDSDDND